MRATEKDYYVYYLSVKYTCITRYEYCSCKSWAIEFWHENMSRWAGRTVRHVGLKRLEFLPAFMVGLYPFLWFGVARLTFVTFCCFLHI